MSQAVMIHFGSGLITGYNAREYCADSALLLYEIQFLENGNPSPATLIKKEEDSATRKC